MKFKLLLRTNGLLMLVLFLVFFSYRLYFWGETEKNFPHVLLNAIGDTLLSCLAGFCIFQLRNRVVRKGYIYAFTTGIFLAFPIILYGFHYWVYSAFHILNKDFLGLFNAICFQLLDSVAIIITGAFATLIDSMHREKKHTQERMIELKQEKLQTELKYLKTQMDPHFIFNSLNTIFYQIHDEDKAARESINQFSDILRYHMLNGRENLVTLNEELQYMRSYIEFQSKRNKDHMDVKSRFEVDENEFTIEPLLLLPLVENAFKFVDGEKNKKGWIDIVARYRANKFEFIVRNSFDPLQVIRNMGSGIGLQNVLKRLQLLYDGKYRLEVHNMEEQGIYTCTLDIWN